MVTSTLIACMLIGAALLGGFAATPASDLYEVEPRQLADLWQKERVSPLDPNSIRHSQLMRNLQSLTQENPGFMELEQVGTSVEGRRIMLASLGSGPQKILLWSQMHGNEPTATCALVDLLQFFAVHRRDPWVADILAKYRLLILPMLNPDGAERNDRRNAQGIDVNRDARVLQTPEGRILKAVRDRWEPFLGFNLHNQNGRTTVGDTGKVATVALLAVAADLPEAGKPRLPDMPDALSKRVTAVLYEALSTFAYGHISRYDEPFNPRAFGDNLTLWGTPIVLIESGGLPAGAPANMTVQLNFVGILAVLNSLSTGRIRNANPAVFDALKLNSDNPIYDLILKNAWICNGSGIPLFRADLAIRQDARAGASGTAIVADLGDLGLNSAHQTVDCTDTLITPGLIAWDPESSLFAQGGDGIRYLRRGILTLIRTAPWADLQSREPAPEGWPPFPGPDWAYVLSGEPQREDEKSQIRLAEWLAAGARAWVQAAPENASRLTGMARVAGWFATPVLPRAEAFRFQVPGEWTGNPAQVLTRWTSEAARAFRLGNRGTITSGSPADLVFWSIPVGQAPVDLRDCRPEKILLNGRLIDLSKPEIPGPGRFLGGRTGR